MSDLFEAADDLSEPDLRAMWQAIRDSERKRSRAVYVLAASVLCVVAIAWVVMRVAR